MKTLDFYFDFLSPYAYFASKRVEAFCDAENLILVWRPVPLGIILRHWGHLGPAEIPPKREHTIRECLLYAQKHELGFGMPAKHPFNSISALRCALPQNVGENSAQVVHAIFDAGWVQSADLGDADVLTRILTEAGLDGNAIIAATKNDDVKAALKTNCENAIQAGAFGVPTFVIEDRLFWGNDQFPCMAQWLEHGELVDESLVQELLATRSAFE